MGLGSPTFFWEGAALPLFNFEFYLKKLFVLGPFVKVNCFCVRLRTTSYIYVLNSL